MVHQGQSVLRSVSCMKRLGATLLSHFLDAMLVQLKAGFH